MMRPFSIIVAFDQDYGIGKNGQLAWHLPEDLQHFKQITSTVKNPAKINAVIMGRNTWESFPAKVRPLPGRYNKVISTKTDLVLPAGVGRSSSLDGALQDLPAHVANVFVIGGGQLYQEAVKHPGCQRLYVTHLKGGFGCDTFFPPLDRSFMLVGASEWQESKGLAFQFCDYFKV